MIYYLSKKGDTATLRLIVGEISKMNAALYGGDIINIDEVLNNLNRDDNINHFNISVSFYDDEEILSDYFKNKFGSQTTIDENKNDKNKDDNQESNKEEIHKDHERDLKKWKCPECGSDEALIDKNGKIYPCINCIKIDTAKELLSRMSDKFIESIENNSEVLERFLNRFKGSKK